MDNGRARKWSYLLLVGVCFLVYANSLTGGFISDDILAITENPHISQLQRYWLNPFELLHSLAYKISALNPFVYHLINLSLHALSTILIFIFLGLFFSPRASLWGALIFAVHPIHTEAVSWISGGPQLLNTIFTLGCYLLYYQATNYKTPIKQRISLYISCLVIFSYFIVEYYSIFPCFVLLIAVSDIVFGRALRNWKLWLPFGAIAAFRLFALKGVIAQRIVSVAAEQAGGSIQWANPLAVMTVSLFSHLWLLLWPVKLSLSHQSLHQPGWIAMASKYWVIILPLLVFAVLGIWRKSKVLVLGLLIFWLYLIPTYSPVAISSSLAERYLYFPSVVLSIILCFFYDLISSRAGKLKVAYVVFLVMLVSAYTLRTVLRSEDWKTPLGFWLKEAEVNPESWKAHNNLGFIYEGEGRVQEAIAEYQKARGLNPGYAQAYSNLGAIYYNKAGRKQEAVSLLKTAIGLNPYQDAAYFNLAAIYINTAEADQAVDLYRKAIKLAPDFVEAYNNLAGIYIKLGRLDQAVPLLEKALELKPDFLKAYNNLGIAYAGLGRKAEAIVLYEKALRINPDEIEILNNLAISYCGLGNKQKAIAVCEQAITLGPKVVYSYNNLGAIYQQMGLFADAIRQYKKAIELDPAYVKAYNNLAEAYMSLGNYQQAAGLLEKALAIDPGYALAHYNLSRAYSYLKELGLAQRRRDEPVR